MSNSVLYYGSQEEPSNPVVLIAGPLSLIYENGFIRHVHLGGEEVLNMIYFAVRDHEWETYHGTIKNEKIKSTKKGFEISYRSVCSAGSIQYVFDCLVKGNNEGKIEFTIRGESFSNFKRNRIGFCVLHSIKSNAGKPLKLVAPDKTETEGVFPLLAEPIQPYINIKSMHWEPVKGWEAELKFDGDIFEMEDQRNWSDATYKTYCTPLKNPLPVEVKMGDTIKQKIVLNVSPNKKSVKLKIKPEPELSLTIGKALQPNTLPGIGIGDSSSYAGYSEAEINNIKKLSLHHLRVEVDVASTGPPQIEMLKNKSNALELPLMLSLNFGNDPKSEALRFNEMSKNSGLYLDSFLIFEKNSRFTTPSLISQVTGILRDGFPGIKIGGGSNLYFAELNRDRINATDIDFLVFPSTPQAHLGDNSVVIENLEGSAGAVISALSFFQNKPVYISPVSLRHRTNVFPDNIKTAFLDQLPGDVDPRQNSLFSASWTLGSVKYIAEAGASQVTYFETTGWKGIMQGKSASSMPSLFRAMADIVFPVYFVFYWLGKLRGSSIIPLKSSKPLMLTGLGLQMDKEKYYLLANHSSQSIDFRITNLKKGNIFSRLNEKNAGTFSKDPLSFFEKTKEIPIDGNIQMLPFELLVIKS